MPSPCGRLAPTVVTTVLSPLQRSVAFAFFQPSAVTSNASRVGGPPAGGPFDRHPNPVPEISFCRPSAPSIVHCWPRLPSQATREPSPTTCMQRLLSHADCSAPSLLSFHAIFALRTLTSSQAQTSETVVRC